MTSAKAAVLLFGLFHGLGLATKLQDFRLSSEGLITNMISFNVGVEAGQLIALSIILLVMTQWRRTTGFIRHAALANVILMTAGFLLMGYQIAGYAVESTHERFRYARRASHAVERGPVEAPGNLDGRGPRDPHGRMVYL